MASTFVLLKATVKTLSIFNRFLPEVLTVFLTPDGLSSGKSLIRQLTIVTKSKAGSQNDSKKPVVSSGVDIVVVNASDAPSKSLSRAKP